MNDHNDNSKAVEYPFNECPPSNNPALLCPDPDTNMQLYLQKLDLLYQNLEGRVQKLETIVVEKYLNQDGSVNSNNRAQAYSLLARNPTDLGINEFSLASNGTNSLNSSSSSSLVSLLDQTQCEILKSDLDDYCLPMLQKRATPSIGELNSIVMNLKKLKYSDLDNKFILSKVREWFRRKREYMSQRIFNICAKKFGNLGLSVEELAQQVRDNPIYIAEIGREANLEILNEAAAWEFCNEKVSSYLDNLATTSNSNINQAQ